MALKIGLESPVSEGLADLQLLRQLDGCLTAKAGRAGKSSGVLQ